MELRGMPVVKAIAAELEPRMEALKERSVVPTLAVLRVGAREDDLSYERGLIKRFESVGAKVITYVIEETEGSDKLLEVLNDCNGNKDIHGILMFRPLPKGFDQKAAEAAIDPEKDVDCMHLINIAHTFAQDGEGYEPCTARAVMKLLEHYEIELTGKNVVVIGRSMVVGKPLSMMLQKANATVTMCHTRTRNLQEICKNADIILAAAGVAKMVDESYVNQGQTVIDVGINVLDGQLCGDVNYESVAEIAENVTPVPGGVGTVTTSILLMQTVKAAEKSVLHLN